MYYAASGIITRIGVMIPEVRIVLCSLRYHHTCRCDDTGGLEFLKSLSAIFAVEGYFVLIMEILDALSCLI